MIGQMHTNRQNRIINALLLHGSFIKNPGLLNGKMGISIFFFHLARQTGNPIYESYAGELLEQIFKNIDINTSASFSSGLSGIGWGVEHLVQNGFVEAGEDNILEELDTAIFQLDRKHPHLLKIKDDFYGYGLYYLCRAKNDIWNKEVLELIWNNLKKLLAETSPNEEKLCPSYIISLLYFIHEIQKRQFCPPGISTVITAIPEFVSKHMKQDLTNHEFQFIRSLFYHLGITPLSWQLTPNNPSNPEEQLKNDGLAVFFTIVFPSVQPTDSSISGYKAGLSKIIRNENSWEKILKRINKEPDLQVYLTGSALTILDEGDAIFKKAIPQPSSCKTIFIINRKSPAAEYGIGTYIKELITILKNKKFNITIIHLEAEQSEFIIENHEGIKNWYIPGPDNPNFSDRGFNGYLRSVVLLIQLYIQNAENLIFHFNFMQDYQLAQYLRKVFACKILLVVHYMEWSIALQGDLLKLKKIIAQPEEKITDPLEKYVSKNVEEDKKFLEYADQVVCLTEYVYDILCQDYGIKPNKITVINNGLSDKFIPILHREKLVLKKKYMANPNEKIILYAGRLDKIKGVEYLLKAFRKVLEHEPNCRLWIIGDGAYNPLLREAEGIWNRICFSGQLTREQLFELYGVAEIGVVPSLFESFGYVAVEMMMYGLPVIATATSGLNEIIEDGVSGLKVQVTVHDGSAKIDSDILAKKMIYLLQNMEEGKKLGQNGRKRYLEKYTSSMMCKKMTDCYQKLLNTRHAAHFTSTI
jgi:glycosyltransferase